MSIPMNARPGSSTALQRVSGITASVYLQEKNKQRELELLHSRNIPALFASFSSVFCVFCLPRSAARTVILLRMYE